jgi:chromosome partitioning protein
VAGTAAELAGFLEQAHTGGIELVIIDTAPHSNADGAIAAQLADLVLIPCRPARFDLDAVVSTLQIVRAANTPAIVIINAAPRGKLAGEAKAALERQGATVLETVLHQRAAYSHAVIDGRSVHEYEPNGAAAAEIEELYNRITGLSGDMKKKKRRAA